MELTVLITASFCKFHPSLIIISEALLSLRYLSLKNGTEVLLVHDRPPKQEERFDHYLDHLNRSLPLIEKCLKTTRPLLIVANSHMHQARTLAYGVSFVKTRFFLKMEHDHVFVRNIPVYDIVSDMVHDSSLKVIRFNRRQNLLKNCDRGYYTQRWKRELSRTLWAAYPSRSQTYTRTVCFSDMNHLSRVDFYREVVLAHAVRASPQMVEATLQPLVIHNHSAFGTYIYGGPLFERTLVHLDASRHNHGEIDGSLIKRLVSERVWLTFRWAHAVRSSDVRPP